MLDDWTAAGPRSRTSGPSPAKPVAMPSHDGVRLNEHQRRASVRPDSGQDDPKQPTAWLEMWAPGWACHRPQLLPQRDVLQDHFLMSLKGQRQRAANQYDHLQHAAIVSWVAGENQSASSRTEFWRTTPFPNRSLFSSGGVERASRTLLTRAPANPLMLACATRLALHLASQTTDPLSPATEVGLHLSL